MDYSQILGQNYMGQMLPQISSNSIGSFIPSMNQQIVSNASMIMPNQIGNAIPYSSNFQTSSNLVMNPI